MFRSTSVAVHLQVEENRDGGPCEALRLFHMDTLYTFLLCLCCVRQSQQARLQRKGFTASWFTFDTDERWIDRRSSCRRGH